MKIYKVTYLMNNFNDWCEKYYKTIDRAIEEAKKLLPMLSEKFNIEYDMYDTFEDALNEIEHYWQYADIIFIEEIKVED